jgi:hypothetical protein
MTHNEKKCMNLFQISFLPGEQNRILYFLLYALNLVWVIGFMFLGNQRKTWIAYDMLAFLIGYIILIYFIRKNTVVANFYILSLLLSLSILYGINILTSGITIISPLKYYYYIRNIPFLLLLAFLIRKKPRLFDLFCGLLYKICFFQFWLNIPFLLYQYTLGWNFDDINGFYGYGACHIACYVWLFIVLCQLNKKTNLFFLFIEIIIMFVLGVITDNKTFFYFSILLILFHYFSSFQFKNIIKSIIMTLSLIVLIIVGINNLPKDQLYFLYGVNIQIQSYFEGKSKDERMTLLEYALHDDDAYYFGKGTGITTHAFGIKGAIYEKLFNHFEMSDTVSIIFENGLAFYLILGILYTVAFLNFFQKRGIVKFIIIFLLFNFNLYYTGIISDPRNIYIFSLIVAVFAANKNKQNYPKFVETNNYKKLATGKKWANMPAI